MTLHEDWQLAAFPGGKIFQSLLPMAQLSHCIVVRGRILSSTRSIKKVTGIAYCRLVFHSPSSGFQHCLMRYDRIEDRGWYLHRNRRV